MRRTLISIVVATLPAWTSIAPTAAQPPRWRSPEAAVQIRLGQFMPSGDSDFWDAIEQDFTIDSSDFDDFSLGFSYVQSVSNEIEVGVNVDFYGETVVSEYRDFVDEQGFPILHDTEFSTVPLTVDVRFVPGGRYRIRPGGRYIPKPAFYVGGGFGLNFWEYEEIGDFIDFSFDPPEIFRDRLIDDGTAFEVHLLAGVEVPLGRRTNLLLEARHSESEDDLSGDFGGLPETELDLGGSSIYGGLSFRF